MDRPAMHRALNKVQEARCDQFNKWGHQDHDLTVWMTILAEEVGELAQEVLRSRTKAHIDVRDILHAAVYEASQVAAVSVAMMEHLEMLILKHEGPFIGGYQQVMIDDAR